MAGVVVDLLSFLLFLPSRLRPPLPHRPPRLLLAGQRTQGPPGSEAPAEKTETGPDSCLLGRRRRPPRRRRRRRRAPSSGRRRGESFGSRRRRRRDRFRPGAASDLSLRRRRRGRTRQQRQRPRRGALRWGTEVIERERETFHFCFFVFRVFSFPCFALSLCFAAGCSLYSFLFHSKLKVCACKYHYTLELNY